MKTVLLVGEPSRIGAMRDALAARDFVVETCTVAEALGAAQAARPDVIAFAPPGEDAARLVASFQAALKSGRPPLVVALGRRDAAARDRCLIAGADDVSVDGLPEDVAERVDALVNGWLRAGPRRSVPSLYRAQRGRQTLKIRVSELDPTGLLGEAIDGVGLGELLRISVPLPGGDLVAWGRVAEAEGERGVRFVGLVAEERTRIASAIQSKPRPSVEGPSPGAAALPPAGTPMVDPRPPASPPGLAPAPPDASASSLPAMIETTLPLGTPMTPGSPPGAMQGSLRPLAPRPTPTMSGTQPARPMPAPSAVEQPSEPTVPTSSSTPPPLVLIPAAPDQIPSATVVAPPPKPGAAPSGGLGSLIDEVLGTVPEARPVAASASEADVLEAMLGSALGLRWPTDSYAQDASQEALSTAASLGLAPEVEGAPPGEVVVAFLRTVSPLERRLFDPEPPSEFADVPLASKALVLRLRLFALARDGERRIDEPGAQWAVDDHAINLLAAEANTVGTQLQKLVDGFMATAQTQRIKETNAIRNQVTKALADLRAVAARMRGERHAPGSSAALLDVAEDVPGGEKPIGYQPKPTKEPEKPLLQEANPFAGLARVSPEVRARRRIIGWGIAFALVVVVRVVTWERAPTELGPADLGHLPGLVSLVISEAARSGEQPALVTATMDWHASEPELQTLKRVLAEKGLKRFRILATNGDLLVQGRTGTADTIYIIRPTATKHSGGAGPK